MHRALFRRRSSNKASSNADATTATLQGLLWARGLVAAAFCTSARDARGNTPLHLSRSDADAAVLLGFGASPKSTNQYGSTPLHAAVLNGEDRMLRQLLNSGGDPTTRESGGGRWSCLDLALCAVNSAELVESSVHPVGAASMKAASMWGVDGAGNSPLHIVCRHGGGLGVGRGGGVDALEDRALRVSMAIDVTLCHLIRV